MGLNRAYLDWNATAPLHPAAREAVVRALDSVGNPSSIHAEGRAARAIIEEARADVAALVGGEAENVVFTSGATEAANALLRQGLAGCCGKDFPCALPVLVGATEHAAVLAVAGDAGRLPVDANGLIRQDILAERLAAIGPAMVVVQLANNETGVVQDIASLAMLAHRSGGAMVVDAVQGPGRLMLDIAAMGADALMLSAHKFGGPKGAGAIVFAESRTRLASAGILGGGQERGQRGGTENVPGLAGMGAAARAVKAEFKAEALQELRDLFESRLRILAPDVRIVGEGVARLPNTSLFALPGITAEKALIAFDLAGVAVSSGSACSSGKVKASHVLEAMGEQDHVKAGAIRLSIGPATTAAEIDQALGVIERLAARERVKNSASKGAIEVSAA